MWVNSESEWSRFATGLSLEVLAVPRAPIRDSPRPRYGAGPPPYTAVEVAFQNAVDNVQLAGTLTVPRGALNAPAVLLSQGLGFEPFDRDYTLPSAPALKSFLAIPAHTFLHLLKFLIREHAAEDLLLIAVRSWPSTAYSVIVLTKVFLFASGSSPSLCRRTTRPTSDMAPSMSPGSEMNPGLTAISILVNIDIESC